MWSQSLAGGWQFRCAGAKEWLPAQVPGSVHADLLALGRIPDPFVADNELTVQWVAERDWEYRVGFRAAPALSAEERVFLVCDGLDALADVALNGQTVGHAENMFRRYRWDVTPLLVGDENELRILFSSPVAYVRARQEDGRPLATLPQSIPGAPYLRKAPCQFGWDWGPRLPPVGVWRDIRLEGYSAARLDDVHLRQRHAAGHVTVSAAVTVERWRQGDLRAVLRITDPDGQVQESEAVLKDDATGGRLEIEVESPQLWWPNGYGPQPLYQVQVALYEGGSMCDRRCFRLGLRTLELRQEPDEFGASFTFVVNGVPIFAKGANWIPPDSLPTRVGDEHLEYLVRSAADAHMNMLRVWGGGFYEGERFYDLCDRYGILVWQDFIFSCSTYPTDDAFFENVRIEAMENVRRLRHRASLALWCGNNEMEWGWIQWGWDKPDQVHLKEAYERMFHHLLPQICAVEDPDHRYWPSSPSSGTPFRDPNGQERGDSHYWGVWHEHEPFTAYREQYPRFVSEFGFQSLPPLETVRTYAGEADWNLTSYIMEYHQRHARGNSLIITQMTDSFRLPKDFPSLVYLSMVLQAEGVRYGVEHWRRNRHRVSGTLYWQLDDCWPVASWSSIDYFGRWKALHYAARRFYAPVLLSAEDKDLRVTLHVTNDLADDWRGVVRWSLETLGGEKLQEGQEMVIAPALSSTRVCALDFSGQVGDDNRREVVLVHELWQGDRQLGRGLVTFVPNKHLKLTDPKLRTAVRKDDAGFEVSLMAERLARFVWLTLEGADVVFSDNCFDLPAGRTVTVTLPAPDGWTARRVRRSLHVCSLFDSF